MHETIADLRIYILGLWRRRWLGMIVCWAVGIIGAFSVFIMPNRYESNARIYVDTASLLGPLLKGLAIEGDVQEEVVVMQRTLLSRPNLRKVAATTDLDLHAETDKQMESLLESIALRTEVKAEGAGLFRVAYEDTDPNVAQKVVQSLLTIFVESNLGQNRSDMQSARFFIEEQLKDYEAKLSEKERRIAEYRAANSEILGQSNYSQRLIRAQEKVSNLEVEYADAVSLSDQLKAQLKATPQFVTMDSAPQIVIGDQAVPSVVNRIRQLQAQLDSLLLQYTENHPDVIATRRQLRRLVNQYNSGESDPLGADFANKTKLPNPVYEQIQIKLIDAEAVSGQTERRLNKAREDLGRLKEFAAIAPAKDAEMADIMREYEVIKANYEALLARRESARISQAVDTKADTVQFRLVEPPEVPATPIGPNRPLFLAIAFFMAIGIGGGAAFLRSQIDETFFDPARLETTFNIPVLGAVTQIASQEEAARKRLSAFVFMVTCGCFVTFYALLYLLWFLFSPASGII